MPANKPVLGLFHKETDFRDHVAKNIKNLEDGLTLLDKEYELPNDMGAGGKIDILARDQLKHIVIIEIKRSDKSARSTLNELSKYISLLKDRDRVPIERIRCIVVSTEWHELLIPLSYFAITNPVHIRAVKAVKKPNKSVGYEEIELLPVTSLPQLSPEVSIYQHLTFEDSVMHKAHAQSLVSQIPFIRLALLRLDIKNENDTDFSPYRTIACIWRIRDEDIDKIESATKHKVGHLYPYAFPGWEAECDVLYWLTGDGAPGINYTSAEEERGTPEKICSLLNKYKLASVERLGNWPKIEVVNTDDEILSQLQAVSPLSSTATANRYEFTVWASPKIPASWDMAIKGFCRFISFEQKWIDIVSKYLSEIVDEDITVHFYAFDKKNFFYAIHQAQKHPNTALSSFEITLKKGTRELEVLRGDWVWDGKTCPSKAEAAIKRIHGSTIEAVLSLYSAVDARGNNKAYYIHGFHPVVTLLELSQGQVIAQNQKLKGKGKCLSLNNFVEKKKRYASAVSIALSKHGEIPTSPSPQLTD